MNRTYRTVEGVDCCTECSRPAIGITPSEALYIAAKRALKYFDAAQRGTYFPANEDLHAARELGAAVALVETEQACLELMDRR